MRNNHTRKEESQVRLLGSNAGIFETLLIWSGIMHKTTNNFQFHSQIFHINNQLSDNMSDFVFQETFIRSRDRIFP